MPHAYKHLNFLADEFQFNFKVDSRYICFLRALFIFAIISHTWIVVSWVLVPCSFEVDTDVSEQHAAAFIQSWGTTGNCAHSCLSVSLFDFRISHCVTLSLGGRLLKNWRPPERDRISISLWSSDFEQYITPPFPSAILKPTWHAMSTSVATSHGNTRALLQRYERNFSTFYSQVFRSRLKVNIHLSEKHYVLCDAV
jgi:hypothetical protein